MKQIIILIYMAVFIFYALPASPQKEEIKSSDMTVKEHIKLLSKWEKLNSGEYTMKVSYNAFSPFKGIWSIQVKDGKVTGWIFKDRKNGEEARPAASMFTQENLFKLAEDAYRKGGDSPYITEAVYSRKGYVIEVTRKRNTEFKGKVPSDRGFRIKVLEINY